MHRIIGILALLAVLAIAGSAACSPPSGTLDAASLGKVEKNIVYGSAGGVELTLDIYYPLQPSPKSPAIVFVHGGGWTDGDKGAAANRDISGVLVSRGYVVASVNYRLAPRFQFPAPLEDVKGAVRFLRAKADEYGIVPERIGAWGESAGGHLAAMLGLTEPSDGFEGSGGYPEQSSRVRAVVNMFGPADLTVDFPVGANLLFHVVFGTADRQSDTIRRASPVSYVSAAAPPFLIIHGDQDPLVPLHQSQELYDKLKAAGSPVELVVVKNGGHGFKAVDEISPRLGELSGLIADFFDRYLK